jgi:TonB family protein
MTRWLRPEYAAEWAGAGIVDSLVLDLRIDPQGRPVDIRVVQPSGSPRLDQSVLQAAPQWRFAWPPSRSPPDAMWARIELRFNGLPQ